MTDKLFKPGDRVRTVASYGYASFTGTVKCRDPRPDQAARGCLIVERDDGVIGTSEVETGWCIHPDNLESLPTPDATSGEPLKESDLIVGAEYEAIVHDASSSAEPGTTVRGIYESGWERYPINYPGGVRLAVGEHRRGTPVVLSTVRRLPASPREWQPKVGETWESIDGFGTLAPVEVVEVADHGFRCLGARGTWYGRPGARVEGTFQLVRLLTPSASTPGGQPNPTQWIGAPHLIRRDPYREPLSKPGTDAQFAAWSAKQDAKHAALVAAHKADLDRGSRSRLVALGGRHGKVVALANRNWPEADEGEP